MCGSKSSFQRPEFMQLLLPGISDRAVLETSKIRVIYRTRERRGLSTGSNPEGGVSTSPTIGKAVSRKCWHARWTIAGTREVWPALQKNLQATAAGSHR